MSPSPTRLPCRCCGGSQPRRTIHPQTPPTNVEAKASRKGVATMEFAPPSFVEVAGRRLAYDEVRPAQPKGTIFLLTGLVAKRQGWRNQLPVFGKEYRTLALDFRDVGDSD